MVFMYIEALKSSLICMFLQLEATWENAAACLPKAVAPKTVNFCWCTKKNVAYGIQAPLWRIFFALNPSVHRRRGSWSEQVVLDPLPVLRLWPIGMHIAQTGKWEACGKRYGSICQTHQKCSWPPSIPQSSCEAVQRSGHEECWSQCHDFCVRKPCRILPRNTMQQVLLTGYTISIELHIISLQRVKLPKQKKQNPKLKYYKALCIIYK